jgi:WD40 repeat protein
MIYPVISVVQDVTHGLQKITEPGGIITDAAFSPDGTALAMASLDGQVKFFQVTAVLPCFLL